MVEYIGNEQVYKPKPHGNSKHSTAEYCRTAPSVLNEIENTGNSVSGTYTKLVQQCSNPKQQGVLNPQNREEVQNVQKHINAKQHISHDDIYNLYVLALELDDFI